MSVVSELKRRNVFRVALFYIVSAWLLVQVAETVLPVFNVPDEFTRGVIVVLVLGFVPALVFAWIFELTPEGIRRESAAPDPNAVSRPISHKLNIATLVVAVFAIGLLAVDRFAPGSAPADASGEQTAGEARSDAPIASPASARSIAVLAFDDLSPEGDQEYFADGISEELLNLLARIDALKVAARTSSFKYKGTQTDIADIGRELNVDTVLEGSVRKAGDQLRITAQLIDARSGFHLWSESFDRQLDNVFAVQDEIAQAIVDQLRLEFDVETATASRTGNEAAYDLYLQGRSLVREPSRDRLLRAVDLFERALELDPEFGAAWSGIADAWLWLEDYGGFSPAEAFPNAEAAARRALALDPSAAEALASMGRVQSSYYNDPQEAERYFRQAIAANPSFIPVYSYYSDSLRQTGRMSESVSNLRRAVELDPLSRFMRSRLAGRLTDIGAFEESWQRVNELLAEDPGDAYAREERANLRMIGHDYIGAIEDYRFVHFARPGDPYSASNIAEIGVYMDVPELIEPWIAAAREQGSGNRWELNARRTLARSRNDHQELQRLGSMMAGDPLGIWLQATAVMRGGDYATARPQLIGALRLAGYEAGDTTLTFDQLRPLVDLAFVERELGIEGWDERLVPADAAIEQMLADGSIGTEDISAPWLSARIAAIRGDRDRVLTRLMMATEHGFYEHWFQEADPVFEAFRDDPDINALVADMLATAAAERERLELGAALP